uniref:EF-hand domain-containing protein n=1 Tax=Globodera rostochiensis TaxID=31243 RepID=A0A914HGW7_GLORO
MFIALPVGIGANFGDQVDVHNEQHIKQHLEDKLEIGEREMTKDEERFHYFSMNDLNKDRVLDGIEVWKAIHHTHSEDGELNGPPPQPISDGEVEKAVDDIMKEIDLNGDGLIDYSEYLNKVQD